MEMEVTAEPTTAPTLCGHTPGASPRRGLCQRCYRKLLEAGLPMPPRLRPGPDPDRVDVVAAWVRTLSEDVRRRLSAALMEAR